jgi:hypothetical protein
MAKGEVIIVEKDVLKMVSRQGFIEIFWQELTEARKINIKTSHASIFNSMNERYFNVFGFLRYADYQVFKQILTDKKYKNGKNINS